MKNTDQEGTSKASASLYQSTTVAMTRHVCVKNKQSNTYLEQHNGY